MNEYFIIGFTSILGGLGFLAGRVLINIDRSIKEACSSIKDHEKRLSHLEGEHDLRKQMHFPDMTKEVI